MPNPNPRTDHLAPHQFKKGQVGNPNGRPKGKSMKDYARMMLERMTDEERMDYLQGIPKEVIWKMTEGNPSSDSTVEITAPKPLLDGIRNNNSNEEDTPTDEKD